MRHGLRRDGQDSAVIAGVAEVAGAIAGSSITRTQQNCRLSLIVARNVAGSTNHSFLLKGIGFTCAFSVKTTFELKNSGLFFPRRSRDVLISDLPGSRNSVASKAFYYAINRRFDD